MPGDRTDLVRSLYERWNEGDLDGFVELWHAEADWSPTLSGGIEGVVHHGRDGIRKAAEELLGEWDEFRVDPHEFREVDDYVLVFGAIHARPADSDVTMDQEVTWVWQIREGKVYQGRGYPHREQALEAVGLAH